MSKPTFWIAFSGGMDSHVLLHFLHQRYSHHKLHAIHINHQLLPEAHQWEKHCRQVCKKLNVPLKIIRVNVNRQPGESVEAKAREARYHAFQKTLKTNDLLFTAHHQEDQAETCLLQLLRGAGLKGVSAMPTLSHLENIHLVRPLLSFSRKNLEDYAAFHQLKWIDDPSNCDERFDRNFLRHAVFPLLKKRWPQTHKILSRFSRHCAEQEKLLTALAEKDYAACHGEFPDTLSLLALKKLDKSRQKNILRYFIEKLYFPLPSEKILNELLKFCDAAKDKNPFVHWEDTECRRFKDHLFIFSSLSERSPELSEEEKKWCIQHLNINPDLKSIQIKFRQGGEKFKPHNRKHTRTLKNLFQEWKIPPWLRDRIPLIYYHNRLIAIVGYSP